MRLDLDAGRVLMVDGGGRRFIDEDGSRDGLAKAILARPRGSVWMVTDDGAVKAMDLISRKDVYRGLQTGDALRADSWDALALLMGVDADALKDSVRVSTSKQVWAAASARVYAACSCRSRPIGRQESSSIFTRRWEDSSLRLTHRLLDSTASR